MRYKEMAEKEWTCTRRVLVEEQTIVENGLSKDALAWWKCTQLWMVLIVKETMN
jgi:hypothetical protein